MIGPIQAGFTPQPAARCTAPTPGQGPSDVFLPTTAPRPATRPSLAELKQIGQKSGQESTKGGFFGLVASLFEPVVPPGEKLDRQRRDLETVMAAATRFDHELESHYHRAQSLLREAEDNLRQSQDLRRRKENDLGWHYEMRCESRCDDCAKVIQGMIGIVERLTVIPEEPARETFHLPQAAANLTAPKGPAVKIEDGHLVLPGARLKMRRPEG